jgi:hypothetical protein
LVEVGFRNGIWHGKIRNFRLCGGPGCYWDGYYESDELELLRAYNTDDNKILNKKEAFTVIDKEEVFEGKQDYLQIYKPKVIVKSFDNWSNEFSISGWFCPSKAPNA